MLPYPHIDPYLIDAGFLRIRWYGFMYVLAILCAYALAVLQLKQKGLTVETNDRLRCCLYIGAGMFAGARLGQALFYNLARSLDDPWSIPAFWQGGMSSHGAFAGVVFAAFLFVSRNEFRQRTGIGFLQAMDIIIPGVPLGLAFIRIGNFINGSLFGRVAEVPWAMVFPGGGSLPRHPSQIYQFLLEGMILFLVLWLARKKIKAEGGLFCLFLIFHSLFRFFLEFFKEPEVHPGFIYGLTRGQILSAAVFCSGLAVYFFIRRKISADN